MNEVRYISRAEAREALRLADETDARERAERDAIPSFVANACQCRICGAPADRHGGMFQCTANPDHIADTVTGLFSDCSYPGE